MRRRSRMCGSTSSLPSLNMGRASVSSTCIRRPSVVKSKRSCDRRSSSRGSALRACSIFSWSSWRNRRWASLGRVVWRSWIRSFSPSLKVGSGPPPGIALVLADDLSPPAIAIARGVLKYSATASRCSLLEAVRIHMTRNSAMRAVMKSARAIFQLPPWWAWTTFLRRMMIVGLAPDPRVRRNSGVPR